MRVLVALKESDKLLGALQCHYAMRGNQGVLYWYDIETNKENYPVSIADIGRDEWQPYFEVKEIRPERAGELWQYGNLFEWCTVRKNEVLEMICARGKDIETVDKMNLTIHGKNDWKLLYSPDKEVMDRIKELEDENVERIEIEGIRWYQNRDKCIVPEIDNNIADSLLDRPPMKMILELQRIKHDNTQ